MTNLIKFRQKSGLFENSFRKSEGKLLRTEKKKRMKKHTYTNFSGMLSTLRVITRDTYIGFKFKSLRFLFRDSCPGGLKHTKFINTKFKSYSSERLTTSVNQTRFNWMEEYPEPHRASLGGAYSPQGGKQPPAAGHFAGGGGQGPPGRAGAWTLI